MSLLLQCCTCLHQANIEPEIVAKPKYLKPARLRPLLADLETEFQKYADKEGCIQPKNLASIWYQCAMKKNGQLTQEDKDAIAEAVQLFVKAMDLDGDGRVSYVEFMTHMLADEMEGMDESKKMIFDFRKDMQSVLSTKPEALNRLLQSFQSMDADQGGRLSQTELAKHMQSWLPLLPQETKDKLTSAGGGKIDMDQAAKCLMEEIDIDKDGQVDYFEFLAFCLGRRKQPVELMCYDISQGVSNRFSPILLGKKFEAIYHSGTLVFGTEYWFGGRIFQNKPPCQCFPPPLDNTHHTLELTPSNYPVAKGLYNVKLGYTLRTQKELMDFLVSCKPRYTPESYDVLTHNCNCFSNEVVTFLTGKPIPDAILKLPELVMKTPTARLLRPLLNKWLGGFAGGKEGHTEPGDYSQLDHADPEHTEKSLHEMLSEVISEKTAAGKANVVVSYKPQGESRKVLAQVMAVRQRPNDPSRNLLDLRWWDTELSQFNSCEGVPEEDCTKGHDHVMQHGSSMKDQEMAMAALAVMEDHAEDDEAKAVHREMSNQLHRK